MKAIREFECVARRPGGLRGQQERRRENRNADSHGARKPREYMIQQQQATNDRDRQCGLRVASLFVSDALRHQISEHLPLAHAIAEGLAPRRDRYKKEQPGCIDDET